MVQTTHSRRIVTINRWDKLKSKSINRQEHCKVRVDSRWLIRKDKQSSILALHKVYEWI